MNNTPKEFGSKTALLDIEHVADTSASGVDRLLTSTERHRQKATTTIGRGAVSVELKNGATDEDVKKWVSDMIAAGRISRFADNYEEKFEWDTIKTDDSFLLAHRDDVLVEAIKRFAGEGSVVLQELIDRLSDGNEVPQHAIDTLAVFAPEALLDNIESFPNFRFTMKHIDAIFYGGHPNLLIENWKLVDPTCLQYVVDISAKKNAPIVELFFSQLPDTITFTEETLEMLAHLSPSVFSSLLQVGRFPEVSSSVAVLTSLSKVGCSVSAATCVSDALLQSLSIEEVVGVFQMFTSKLVQRLDALGLLDNDETVAYILGHHKTLLWRFANQAENFSRHIQSCIFKELVRTSGSDPVTSDVRHFTQLQPEDYVYLIDNAATLVRFFTGKYELDRLFAGAESSVKARFDSEVVPLYQALVDRIAARDAKNDSRSNQRSIESMYNAEGNIILGEYTYDEPLSDSDIIDANERGHCVRTAPRFVDIAADTSRQNMLMCTESPKKLESYQLGDVNEAKSWMDVSEYHAVNDMLQYLQYMGEEQPGDEFYDDFINNLTFIGEKEYAEAVKGIALCWKWFLDKDSKNQLCAITAVTDNQGYGDIKSDQYMLDRILEYFSDDELAQYKGRLLLHADELTQTDSQKVKVVLLDDWTISGSQLREGFTAFAEVHPKLVSSVEVQLIAASRQRIASGIEGFRHEVAGEPVEERNLPIVTRAYYVAHTAESAGVDVNFARISGSHSSVDFGFSDDLHTNKSQDTKVPGLASIFRPYRQKDYTTKNIARLRKVHGIVDNRHEE